MRADGDPVQVTAGEVTAVAVEQGAAGRHELVITGLDLTHRLTHAPKRRTFQRMSDADIARRIAAEYSPGARRGRRLRQYKITCCSPTRPTSRSSAAGPAGSASTAG